MTKILMFLSWILVSWRGQPGQRDTGGTRESLSSWQRDLLVRLSPQHLGRVRCAVSLRNGDPFNPVLTQLARTPCMRARDTVGFMAATLDEAWRWERG